MVFRFLYTAIKRKLLSGVFCVSVRRCEYAKPDHIHKYQIPAVKKKMFLEEILIEERILETIFPNFNGWVPTFAIREFVECYRCYCGSLVCNFKPCTIS